MSDTLMGYWPAVRLSGEVYPSDCCHECALRLAAETRGWTIDELNQRVTASTETLELGYFLPCTEEFRLETGE